MLSGTPSVFNVAVCVMASATSFFAFSNFVVWMGSAMYPHTIPGLISCYVAAIPFYTNDLLSTSVTAGAVFGLPALASTITKSLNQTGCSHTV
jgi:hypothetical protein